MAKKSGTMVQQQKHSKPAGVRRRPTGSAPGRVHLPDRAETLTSTIATADGRNQAHMLAREELQGMQRLLIAAHIGQLHGNRHVLRMVDPGQTTEPAYLPWRQMAKRLDGKVIIWRTEPRLEGEEPRHIIAAYKGISLWDIEGRIDAVDDYRVMLDQLADLKRRYDPEDKQVPTSVMSELRGRHAIYKSALTSSLGLLDIEDHNRVWDAYGDWTRGSYEDSPAGEDAYYAYKNDFLVEWDDLHRDVNTAYKRLCSLWDKIIISQGTDVAPHVQVLVKLEAEAARREYKDIHLYTELLSVDQLEAFEAEQAEREQSVDFLETTAWKGKRVGISTMGGKQLADARAKIAKDLEKTQSARAISRGRKQAWDYLNVQYPIANSLLTAQAAAKNPDIFKAKEWTRIQGEIRFEMDQLEERSSFPVPSGKDPSTVDGKAYLRKVAANIARIESRLRAARWLVDAAAQAKTELSELRILVEGLQKAAAMAQSRALPYNVPEAAIQLEIHSKLQGHHAFLERQSGELGGKTASQLRDLMSELTNTRAAIPRIETEVRKRPWYDLHAALETLLENVMADNKLSLADKARVLKQIRRAGLMREAAEWKDVISMIEQRAEEAQSEEERTELLAYAATLRKQFNTAAKPLLEKAGSISKSKLDKTGELIGKIDKLLEVAVGGPSFQSLMTEGPKKALEQAIGPHLRDRLLDHIRGGHAGKIKGHLEKIRTVLKAVSILRKTKTVDKFMKTSVMIGSVRHPLMDQMADILDIGQGFAGKIPVIGPTFELILSPITTVCRGLSPAIGRLHKAMRLRDATLAAITGVVPPRRRWKK